MGSIVTSTKLYGHPIQDLLPAHRRAFDTKWQVTAEEHASSKADQVKQYYNQHARPLLDIGIGSNVAIQDSSSRLWDIYGIVTAIGPHRCYFVKTASGCILFRNWRFLRRRLPTTPGTIQPDQGQLTFRTRTGNA